MRKWYMCTAAKAILVSLAILSCAAFLTSVIWEFNSGGASADVAYEDSDEFEATFANMVENAVTGNYFYNMFGENGEIDDDMLVDVIEYAQTGTISGENESGLSYTIGELRDWGYSVYNTGDIIIGCTRIDGSMYYYYADEFQRLVGNNILDIDVGGLGCSVSEYLDLLTDGQDAAVYYGIAPVYDPETGELLYTSCSDIYYAINELYTPYGADSLLDAVNGNESLRRYDLSEVISFIENAAVSISESVYAYLNEADSISDGNTNFAYIFMMTEGGKVYTNCEKYSDADDIDAAARELISGDGMKYVLITPTLSGFESNMDVDAESLRQVVRSAVSNTTSGEFSGVFAAAVDTSYPIQDAIYTSAVEYGTLAADAAMYRALLIISIIVLGVSTVWLTIIAGRRASDEEIHINAFDRIKTEIAAGIILILGYFTVRFMVGEFYNVLINSDEYSVSVIISSGVSIGMLFAGLVICAAMFYWGYLSLVRRIKAHTVWKNSIVCATGVLIYRAWRSRRLSVRNLFLIAVYSALHWLVAFSRFNVFIVIFAAAADIFAVWYIVESSSARMQIKEALAAMAAGNLNSRIDTAKLKGVNLETAETVNKIGDGLSIAVEKSVRSERMKTELITNVSHDLKTPLTSIINYVELLKLEELPGENAKKYVDVLDEKAKRLKTLTEDVVEASKASSGNIKLEITDVNFAELVRQVEGEFKERMDAADLTLVSDIPDELSIQADARRLWRIMANLYSNIAKYAMPGTRVYSALASKDGKAVFTLKNVSRQPLNISADALTERFIRGDSARSGEGSGLGLSIAKSLTELMGGEFNLYLDGDLFKAEIVLSLTLQYSQGKEVGRSRA